jgi:hypothetical protein
MDKYIALSYVWGDPALSRLIRVDGEAMYITASLDSALRHLRDTNRTRLVWADAICINQGDVEERNQQVRQMAWVYRQADHTIIYLGDGTPETSLFLKAFRPESPVEWKNSSLDPALDHYFSDCSSDQGTLQKAKWQLGSKCPSSYSTLKPSIASRILTPTGAVDIQNGQNAMDSKVEVAAREWILAQPWFKRVWILQELVLSRDPWIQCGTSVARWSSLDNHISDIAKERSLKPEEKIVQDMGKVRLERRRWETSKDIYRFPPFAESLYNLLKSRKGFGVTDPRDMLFANLGVIGQRQGPLQHTVDLELVTVDYQKTEVEVYFDLARFFLNSTVGFGLFSLLDSSEQCKEKQLPSWVPDWVSSPNPKFSRVSDCLGIRESPTVVVWASQSRVAVCVGSFIGEVQELEPIIGQSFDPQIAKDFSELVHRDDLSIQDLLRFVKKSFEETYQQWRHVLGRLIPDPGRLLREFEKHFGIVGDEEVLWHKSYSSMWPRDSKLNPKECLIARDINSTIKRFLKLGPVELRRICKDAWYSDADSSNEFKQLHSLLAQLVFPSFMTDGPNLFFSRRMAIIGNSLTAIVPGDTNVGDAVYFPDGTYPVPLVLRGVCGEIDAGLDAEIKERIYEENCGKYASRKWKKAETVKHFTVVGECFVEGRMGYMDYNENANFHILALH